MWGEVVSKKKNEALGDQNQRGSTQEVRVFFYLPSEVQDSEKMTATSAALALGSV